MRLATALLAAAVGLSAVPATAATVTFSNIRATWFDIVGGTNVSFVGNGTANASVRWGEDTGNGQSGYDFEAIGIPGLTVTPPGGSDITNIGLFRHVNQPIAAGTSITGIKLEFLTDILVDGNPFNDVAFIYTFTHEETPNAADPCAYGPPNGVGVNVNGCADRVTVNFNVQSDFFQIDGFDYALDTVGFLVGGNPATSFLTAEQLVNEAFIRGRLVLYSEAGIPEPATWAMLIAGFGLVGSAMRRRRTAVTA
jgi:hypothetical protein